MIATKFETLMQVYKLPDTATQLASTWILIIDTSHFEISCIRGDLIVSQDIVGQSI